MPRTPHLGSWIAAALLSLAALNGPGCQTPQPSRSPVTLEDVYEQRDALRDSVITLSGLFMGWRGTGCVFPEYAARQEKRSDWILRIGDSCLYVTGGSPPGLSAMEESSTGQRISLQARVRVTSEGRILLEYVDSTPVAR